MPILVVRGQEVFFPDGLTDDAYENVKLNMENMTEEEFSETVQKLNKPIQTETKDKKPTRKQLRESNPTNIDLWTVKQLRAFAKGRHIPEYWKLKKPDLLQFLKEQ